jgi:copper homeostasis protein
LEKCSHPLYNTNMLEIACFNASSALSAGRAGADRIELCADYAAGGVTPPISWIHEVCQAVSIPVNVMIRPRAGDFSYTAAEFEQMKHDIGALRDSASGFVFGILDSEKHVDEARNKELVELAAPLPCTFHRAIDEVEELGRAVESVIRCGFTSILTSGGEKSAAEGAERATELQEHYGQDISLILGGGVRSANLAELKERTAVPWLHSAAITRPGEDVDSEEVRTMQQALGAGTS